MSARSPLALTAPESTASAHVVRRGDQREPGRRVGLDDVRWRPAPVLDAFEALHRTHRRDPDLDGMAGIALG